jgi:hypothetical protein
MGLGSGIRDPGSGVRKNPFRIPDPGVKKAPDPRSRIRIRNTAKKPKISFSMTVASKDSDVKEGLFQTVAYQEHFIPVLKKVRA